MVSSSEVQVTCSVRSCRQLSENVERVFEAGQSHDDSEREGELLQKIGELTVERDFLAKGLGRLR